jgi:hypothetical protein
MPGRRWGVGVVAVRGRPTITTPPAAIRERSVRNTTTLLLVGLLVALVAATVYQLLTAANL